MNEYLCIYVDAAGRPAGGRSFEARNDEAAIEKAHWIVQRRGIEGYVLWRGEQRVFASGPLLEL